MVPIISWIYMPATPLPIKLEVKKDQTIIANINPDQKQSTF